MNSYCLRARSIDRLLIFDKSGNFRTSILRGDGKPFTRIGSIVPSPDGGFIVYDARARTNHPVSRDLRVGTPSIALAAPSLVLPSGQIVSAAQIRSPALVGFPIHVMDREGRVTRSFGADLPEYRPDLKLFTDRIVGPGRLGTIWSAPKGRYVLEQWDPLKGLRIAKVSVRSTWFKDSESPQRDEMTRPQPILESVWEDKNCLWVLLRDGDAEWKPSPPVTGERPFNVIEYARNYDWVLEAIDAATGRVLASSRFRDPVWGRSPSQFLVIRDKAAPSNYRVSRPVLRGSKP